jgi:hypothetical protein
MKHLLPSIIIVSIISCSAPKQQQLIKYSSIPGGVPDYANLDLWAAHPDKWDPSDSIPKPLRNTWHDTTVDVFFLHPTTFTDPARTNEFNAPIDDDSINRKTDYSSIMYQASVFNADTRVFAPRYRQAHLGMYYYKDTARALQAFDTAYSDIRRAFMYYLSQNPGRPIIIASHSQGTTHAIRLLKEFFDTTSLKNRLVVAYLIGIPVDKNQYDNIPLCKDSLQTGCFVSWRTFRRGTPGSGYKSDSNAAVVNPLTWKADTLYASKKLHKGAVLYKFNKTVKHPNDAQVHKNILWISRPKFFGGFLYKAKNYHAGDYNLFYLNVREDIRRRIRLFWK